MKKIITFVLALILCISPLAFFGGCGSDENFWETTHAEIVKFSTDEKYKFVWNEEILTYSSQINDIISNTDNNYYELNYVYNQTSLNSLHFFNKYKSNLQLKPLKLNDKTQKQIKKSYETFDKRFNEFQSSCNRFVKAYNEFNKQVTTDLVGAYSQQKLKDFKREYYRFITDSIEFNKTFKELYLLSYQDIHTTDENMLAGIEKIANADFIESLNLLYVKIELDTFNGLANSYPFANDLLGYIKDLKNNDKSEVSPDVDVLFPNWLVQYDYYKNQIPKVHNSIDNLEFNVVFEDYNGDFEKYINENQNKANFYQTYISFKQTIVPTMFLTTCNLFI